MQKTSLRQVNHPLQDTIPLNENFLHFSLNGMLPEGHVLVLNTTLGTLSHLAVSDKGPELKTQQQFTESEVCVLIPLLKSYPHYCPYEELLANFTESRHVTPQAIERYRQRLHDAQFTAIWDQEMRPVRNVLSRARLKIHAFNMDIIAILETGYVLMGKSKRRRQAS